MENKATGCWDKTKILTLLFVALRRGGRCFPFVANIQSFEILKESVSTFDPSQKFFPLDWTFLLELSNTNENLSGLNGPALPGPTTISITGPVSFGWPL